MKKPIALMLVFSGSALLLQGCVPVIFGAAAAGTGSATYYGHDSVNQFLNDSAITKASYRKLRRNPRFASAHIIVSVKNGNVLLAGQVPDPSLKSEAENAIRNVDGIRTIYNFITVSGPSSDLVRSSDSWITTKIKSQLVATKGIPANRIKVVTENGVVYLMGSIPLSAADASVNVARQVAGVQKVVKLFEYR